MGVEFYVAPMHVVVLVFLLLAQAEESASSAVAPADCAKSATTTLEMIECGVTKYEQAEAQLISAYEQAMKSGDRRQTTAPKARQTVILGLSETPV